MESALGPAALVDAAAVIRGFDAMTRIADATGIPLEGRVASQVAAWVGRAGIGRFAAMKV